MCSIDVDRSETSRTQDVWYTNFGDSWFRWKKVDVNHRLRGLANTGDSAVPMEQMEAIMVIGDVDVLKRIERQDRRAEKASQLLIKKLSRKKRNQRLSTAIVEAPTLPPMAFASATNFVMHEDTVVAQRRLVKARDEDGKRAFYVGEIGSSEDGAMALLVVPKSKGANADLLCERVLKRRPTNVKVSSQCVCVIQSCGNEKLFIHNETTTRALLRKVHIENGVSVFYVTPCANTNDSPPWSLGLDKKTYTELQWKLSRLLGAKFIS